MEIVSLAERPDLGPAAFEIPYGADDGVFMQGSPVPLLVRRSRLVKRWPDYVLVLVDQTGSAVARGVMVPFCAQEPGRERFPAGGGDQVAIWAAEDAMAERSPGFVWRYPTSGGHLSGADLLDNPLIIINLSVWQSYEHLHAFTYRSTHGHYVRRRAEWFTPLPTPKTALWWIAANTQPTPTEAIARLQHLRRVGPSPQAFTVRRRFDRNGRSEARQPRQAQRASVFH